MSVAAPIVPGTHWYFAAQPLEAGSGGAHLTVSQDLAILNPNAVPAPVTIAYYPRNGRLHVVRVTVPARSTWLEDIGRAVPGPGEVAIAVTSPRVISVQRVVRRRLPRGRTLGSNVTPGVMAPSRRWLFAEGYVGLSYDEYLSVFNPGSRPVRVVIRAASQGAGIALPAPVALDIRAWGQGVLDARRLFGRVRDKSLGLMIEAPRPVVALRALYWGAHVGALSYGTDARPGAAAGNRAWYFTGVSPDGMNQPFVTLLAPERDAAVTVVARDARGRELGRYRVHVPGGHRATLKLFALLPRVASPVAVAVTADRPVVAEIPQYAGGSPNLAGHAGDVIAGVAGGVVYAHLPYLDTEAGRRAIRWLDVYNPGADKLSLSIEGYDRAGRHAVAPLVVRPGATARYDVARLGQPRGVLGLTLTARPGRFVAYAQGDARASADYESVDAMPLPPAAQAAVVGPPAAPASVSTLVSFPAPLAGAPVPPAPVTSATAVRQPARQAATTAPLTDTANPLNTATIAPGQTATDTAATTFSAPSRTAAPSGTAPPAAPTMTSTSTPQQPSPTRAPPSATASASPSPTTAPSAAPRLTLSLVAPGAVAPGNPITYTVAAMNTSDVTATHTTARVTFPDGTSGVLALGAVAAGATVTGTLSWIVPAVPAKGSAESDADYLARLGQADGSSLVAYASLSWQDDTGASYGPVDAQAASTEHLPNLRYTAVSGPDTLVPGTVVTTTVTVRNVGSGEAAAVTARVTNPDGSISGAQGGALATGASTTLAVTWLVPTLPHATTEGESVYAARLTALDARAQAFAVGLSWRDGRLNLSWRDGRLNSYGEIGAGRAATERVPVVGISLDGPRTPVPGTTVAYTVSLTNTGSVAAALLNLSVVMPDSTLHAPDAGGALGPGESRQVTVPYSVPLTLPAGAFVAHARVTWQDSAQNAYGPRATIASTTVADEPALQIGLGGPSTATAGDAITYTVTLTNTAISSSAEADAARITLIFPDRSRRTVDAGDPIAPGASRAIPVSFTIPATQTAGDAPALAAVTWQDHAGNTLGPREAFTTTNIIALPTATPKPTDTATPPATPTSTATSTPTPTNTATFTSTNTPLPYKANGLDVFVGYADNARANPNLPVPWNGSPNTTFIGDGGPYDSGAIRLDNTTGTTISVSDVSTYFPNHNEYNGQTIDLWGSFTVAPHGTTILAETNGGNFDTSDYGIPGFSCGNLAGPNDNPPQITIKVGDGTTTVLSDTGHILDTGGVDSVNCYGNESLQWRALGTVGSTQAGANLVLVAPSSDPVIGTPYTQTAQLTDPSGHALPNVAVDFAVNSGPNAGTTGQGTTDSDGIAAFTYTGTVAGTDVLAASVTNSSGGTFTSDPISVTWVSAPPTPRPTITRTPTPIPTNTPTVGPTGTPGPSATPEPTIETPGWIGSPANGAALSCQVPITLASGEILQQGIVDYYPADDPSALVTLTVNAHGSGTIATLDTTTLEDGSYIIRLRGTDINGNTLTSEVYVTVTGDCHPGHVRFTITDLTVPVAGLPISIQRTYNSLERKHVGDFGYGWSLEIQNAHLQVDPAMNVTLNLPNGKRSTFYFAPQGHILYYTPSYVAGAGVYGSLTADGCFLFESGSNGYYCMFGDGPNGMYQPGTYTYTDPYGRVYVYGADGRLRSVRDLSGNTLTIGSNGIVSSAGDQVVSFARDSQGRITGITDPDGNVYRYSYDAKGNLSSVATPSATVPVTYTYDAEHLLLTAVDARSQAEVSDTYYPDGRLKSVADPMGHTTSYAYDLGSNTTTTTRPDGGMTTTTYDGAGNVVSETDALSRTTAYTYDGNGNTLSRTDSLGHITTYTYDGNGNRTSVTDSLGRTNRVTYNDYGRLTSTTDALGNVRMTTYDANQNPTSVGDSLGTTGGYTWDDHGNPLTKTDGNGQTTAYAYDAYGNPVSETDPAGNTTIYTYDDMGRRLANTDALTHTTRTTYDALGHVLTSVDALGNATRYEYDAGGNKIAEIDPLGRRTAYEYDAANHLATVTYPDGSTKGYTYDYLGNKLTATDQAGHITHDQYDFAGELVSTTYADGTADAATVRYGYDAAGRKVSETDERGNSTRYGYDDAGHLISEANPFGHVTTYTYDDDGRKVSETDPNNHQTWYAYDARGHLIQTTYADGTTRTQTYDGAGNVVGKTDQAGKTTRYGYDSVDELSTVTDALGQQTSYTYDARGNQTSQTDANGHTTAFAYDAAGHQIKRTLPLGMSETFVYDALGNRSRTIGFNGWTTTYTYDVMNWLVGMALDPALGEVPVGYAYTPTGQRAAMTDASGTTTYTYDARDRLVSKATPEGTLAYGYDAAGNLLSIRSSHPGGTAVDYTYDDANRLTMVTDNHSLTGSTTYSYDPEGNLSAFTYPNDVTWAYSYNTLNRLTNLTIANTTPLASYAYTLGPAGNRLAVTETDGRRVAYSYDDIYRLTKETISNDPIFNDNGSVDYSYDAVGNRLSCTSTVAAISSATGTYDANDHLIGDSYDQNGNTTASGLTTYTYDAANRLISAKTTTGTVTTLYDGDGNRVAETVGGVTTTYLIDDRNPTGYAQVVEEEVNGAVQRTYTYGHDRIDQDRLTGGTWSTSFYGYDGLGNVRFLMDPSGAITDRYEYDAFGHLIASSGTTPNPYLYMGERYDQSVGLYYLRARYYNVDQGRLISADPYEGLTFEPVTLHKYLYAGADPIDNSDPTGEQIAIDYGLTLDYTALRTVVKIAAVGIATACPLVLVASLVAGAGGADIGALQQSLLPAPLDKCVGNRMIVQLQENQGLRGGKGRTQTEGVVNLPNPGVTTRQVRDAMFVLYLTQPTAATWFPTNKYGKDFSAAIVRASEDLKRFPPAGYDLPKGQVISINIPSEDYYRLDIENVVGWNLRE